MSDFNAGLPASSAPGNAAGDASGNANNNGGSGDYLSALAQVKALAARASQAQMQPPPQSMMSMGQPPFMQPPQSMMPPMSQQPSMPGAQPLLQQPQSQQQQPQQQQHQQESQLHQQQPPMVKRGADETEGAPEAKRPPSSSSPPAAAKMAQPPLMSQPPPMASQLGGHVPSISAGAQQKSQQSQGQKEPELAPGEEVDNVMIPSDKVGMVIGKGGEKINWLQEQSGARLQMIQDDPYAKEKPLRMVGSREKIEHAKKLVKDLIDPEPEDDPLYPRMGGLSSGDIVSNLSAYRSKTVQVKVPRVAVGRVIGRGGETIKRIQAETGARVQFEQENNQEFRTATVSGTVAVIEEAEKMIMDIIQEAEASSNSYGRGGGGGGGGGSGGGGDGGGMGSGTGSGQQRPRDDRPREPMLVPGERAGLIIGRGGDSIRNIMQQSGAHISLDRQIPPTATGEKTFMITGNPDEIATARRLIQEKLDSYRPNYSSRGSSTSRGPPGMQSGGFPQHFGGYPQGQPQQGAPPGQPQQQQNPPHFGGGYQGHGGGSYQYSHGYNQQQPYQQQYQQHQPPPPPTQPPPAPGQQQQQQPQQQYHQQYYQQQQQQQRPPPSSSASSQQPQQQQQVSAPQPAGQSQQQPQQQPQQQQQQHQQQAVPPGYPTHEQYLQYKEWYNAQGYYGYPPSQSSGAGTN